MKNKLMTLLIVVICVLVSLVGCNNKEYTNEEIYEEFKEMASKIESYTCLTEIDVIGDNGKSSYTLKQSYKKPNEYKVEFVSPEHLKGKVMEYKDDKVIIKNPNINDSIELPNKNDGYVFIGAFISSYLENKEVKVNSSNGYITLETNIVEDKGYFNNQILYINKENKLPEKMEMLNEEGNARIIVRYKDIEYKK
ncbi:MAG: germination lipoprotein GerS [Peptostreptococcaceae bacterium]